jgi:predicted ATPase
VAERLETAIGLTPGAFTVEETFWAARRLIETVAAGRPLIVIVNDLHWAEKTFLDLIAHLADTIEAPVVIVGSARPELLEDHPDWDGGDAAPGRRVTLQPLSATESGQVITHRWACCDR